MAGRLYNFYPTANYSPLESCKTAFGIPESNRLLEIGGKEYNRILYPGRIAQGGKPIWKNEALYKKNTINRGSTQRAASLIKRDFLMRTVTRCIRTKISFKSKIIDYDAVTRMVSIEGRPLLQINDADGLIENFISRPDFTNMELLFLRNFGVRVVKVKNRFLLTVRIQQTFLNSLPLGKDTFRGVLNKLFDSYEISETKVLGFMNRRGRRNDTPAVSFRCVLKPGLIYPYRHIDIEGIPEFLLPSKDTFSPEFPINDTYGDQSKSWREIIKCEIQKFEDSPNFENIIKVFIRNLFSASSVNSSYLATLNKFSGSGDILVLYNTDTLSITFHKNGSKGLEIVRLDVFGREFSRINIPFNELIEGLADVVLDPETNQIYIRYTPDCWQDLFKLLVFGTGSIFKNNGRIPNPAEDSAWLDMPLNLPELEDVKTYNTPIFTQQYLTLLCETSYLIPLFYPFIF